MTYAEQISAALAELDQLSQIQARKEVFKRIAIQQQLDMIAIAITANTHN